MLFRNLTMFCFPPASVGINALTQALERYPLRDLGPLELRVGGFVPPSEHAHGPVYATAGSALLVCLGVNERILPARVIADAVDKKVRQIQDKDQRSVGKKERARLKEEVLTELAPRAFVRKSLIHAYLEPATGWLVVDTASRKSAEMLVGSLRVALGSFPASSIQARVPLRVQFTDWLTKGQTPPHLEFGEECELREASGGDGKWVGRNVDLQSSEVGEHLAAGKQAVRLGLSLGDEMQFVLSEDLTLRKTQFDAVEQNAQSSQDGDEFANRFVLMTLQVRRLQEVLEGALGVEAAQHEVGAAAGPKKSRRGSQAEFAFDNTATKAA